jgi:hypothetical protein
MKIIYAFIAVSFLAVNIFAFTGENSFKFCGTWVNTAYVNGSVNSKSISHNIKGLQQAIACFSFFNCDSILAWGINNDSIIVYKLIHTDDSTFSIKDSSYGGIVFVIHNSQNLLTAHGSFWGKDEYTFRRDDSFRKYLICSGSSIQPGFLFNNYFAHRIIAGLYKDVSTGNTVVFTDSTVSGIGGFDKYSLCIHSGKTLPFYPFDGIFLSGDGLKEAFIWEADNKSLKLFKTIYNEFTGNYSKDYLYRTLRKEK